jgi:F420-non-reducing hydrogenase iron-sulfur subunit
MNFRPTIVAFLCNWCAYTGADLAGTSRLHYAPNIRIVRVMCSGRIEPSFILKAFQQGADGVLICGCHPGDCHYLLEKYIAQMGIEKERLKLEWISASEGKQFAALVNSMTLDILNVGPSKIKSSLEVEHLKR